MTGSTGSMYICSLEDNNIHILPIEPVNVVVWGDNNIHILSVEPVNVVV
jgi:hypothetical protein